MDQTHSRQSDDKPLAKKMRLVLNALGMPDEEITKLNFHLLAAARAKEYPPAVNLPTGLQSIQDWIDQNSHDVDLLHIAEFLMNNGEQSLADYYWTPDDNGMSLRQCVVMIRGTPTFPTGWWTIPVLDQQLPMWSHKGIDLEVEEEPEIPEADLEELRRLIEADEDEDDK